MWEGVGWAGWIGVRRGEWDNCSSIINKYILKKECRMCTGCNQQRSAIQVTKPPYSPDLVPCDFWLFPKLKSPLKGKRFQTVDEIQENRIGS